MFEKKNLLRHGSETFPLTSMKTQLFQYFAVLLYNFQEVRQLG